ncbi:hypothetical protein ABZN20_14870 [Methylococcus sp. ANG]
MLQDVEVRKAKPRETPWTVYGRRQSVAEASLPGTAGKSEPEAKFFVTT